MTTQSNFDAHNTRSSVPKYVTTSAIAVPLMVLTGWAFLASILVALLLWGTWIDKRGRTLRWWAGLTAALYAIPFAQYLLNISTADSMSKMLHPWMGFAIATPAIIVVAKIFWHRR